MRDDILTDNPEKLALALKGLYEVCDPEIGLNIIDLGLIFEIYFYEESEKLITVVMTLTTQFCPMGDAIKNGVIQSLTDSFPGYQFDISLIFKPAWNYTRLSPQGKEFLGQ